MPQTADFYLCGPPAFLTELTAALESWGVPYSRIHSETFGTESAVTPGIAAVTAQDSASTARNLGGRSRGFLYPEWPVASVGFPVSKYSRIRRSLRYSCQVVVPGRRLPHVRVRPDRRRGSLRP